MAIQIRGDLKQQRKCVVLIALYRSGRYIRSKLASLRLIKELDQALVVFLNCQNIDGESEILSKPLKRNPNYVEIVFDDHLSLYETWDYAIENTNSEYVCNYNADDQWHPDYLTKCMEYLDNTANVSIVSTQVLVTDEPNQIYPNWNCMDRLPAIVFPASTAGPSPMWRRSMHERYGGFGKYKVIGDAKFWERMLIGKEEFGLIREDLVLYYCAADSLERRVDPDTGRYLRDLDAWT